jgi:hypothetical protein
MKNLSPNKRAIPLDPWLLRDIQSRYFEKIMKYVRGDLTRFGPLGTINIETVDGKSKTIRLAIHRRTSDKNKIFTSDNMISGGFYRPADELLSLEIHTPTVEYHLRRPSPKIKAANKKLLMEQLEDVLKHELTHVRDVINLSNVHRSRKKRSRSLNSDYFNSAHEVRAYGRQIADAVADHVARIPLNLNTSDINLGDQILDRIQRVNQVKGFYWTYFTAENQQKIARMVVARLEQEAML